MTFAGSGFATITITDYYFCEPTTIVVLVASEPTVDSKYAEWKAGDIGIGF